MQDSRISPKQIGENFPVASQLLPEPWRQAILDFYSLVRGMDDISDNPQIKREEKRDQLRLIRLGFQEHQPEILPGWALPCYQRVESGQIQPDWPEALWQAFWQDTERNRYQHFSEVLDYCRLSAVPVGRALLEITQQHQADVEAVESLAIAMQLINHLRDVRSDYLQLGRIYLPQEWLHQAGISEKVLEKAETGPKLRQVFDRWLDEADVRLKQANALPPTILHRGLRSELRVMIALARSLSRQLRKRDPMAGTVRLSVLRRNMVAMGALLGLC